MTNARDLIIEVWSGETRYASRFDTRGVDDEDVFVKACTKAVMWELRRQGVKPDRMRQSWLPHSEKS